MYVENTELLQTLGENLNTIRSYRGYTQTDLSLKTDIHRCYISGIERGTQIISVKRLWALSAVLKVSAMSLLNPYMEEELTGYLKRQRLRNYQLELADYKKAPVGYIDRHMKMMGLLLGKNRVEEQVSKAVLAASIGRETGFISRIEQGTANLNILELDRLAAELRTSSMRILAETAVQLLKLDVNCKSNYAGSVELCNILSINRSTQSLR